MWTICSEIICNPRRFGSSERRALRRVTSALHQDLVGGEGGSTRATTVLVAGEGIEPGDLIPVRTALQQAGIDYESAESSFVPSVTVALDEDGARKIFKLIDAIEDSDDVQNVYSNFDVSDDVMALIDA